MNSGRQGHDKHRVCTIMTIARVQGDYNDGASSLVGRIGWKLNKPDLAS
jgi:hypothetical protein